MVEVSPGCTANITDIAPDCNLATGLHFELLYDVHLQILSSRSHAHFVEVRQAMGALPAGGADARVFAVNGSARFLAAQKRFVSFVRKETLLHIKDEVHTK